jgi:hypothetical protein
MTQATPGRPRTGHSFWKPVSWIFATLLGVVISMIIGATALQPFITRSVSHVTWFIEKRGAKPTCNDTGYYNQIRAINSNAVDIMREDNGTLDTDTNTSDDNRRTAWAEDKFGTRGLNRDVISWNFKSTSHVKLICVRNGLANTPFSFDDTGQVKLLHIDCGSTVFSHTFPNLRADDSRWEDYQDVTVNCETKAVVFVIKTIYPARDKSNSDEVAISDVQFYG